MKNSTDTGFSTVIGLLVLITSGLLFAAGLHAETVTYKYDVNGRLVDADFGGKGSHVYTYDKAGNILTETIVARARYALQVSVNPEGGGSVTGGEISCPSQCSALVPEGDLVSLTAEAETDFVLLGWSGACTGTGACDVAMDAPKKVTAKFAPLTYNIDGKDVPKAIPDYDADGVESTLVVPAGPYMSVSDVDVHVDITHPYIGDLVVKLTHAGSGRSARLFVRSCGSSDNIIAVFDDEAAASLQCPPNGTYKPAEPLSVFDGVNAAGRWILSVSDNAGADKGTLNSWSITLRCSTTPLTPQLTVTKAGTGSGNVTPDKGSLAWTGNTGMATYDYNTSVTLTAKADSGSTFAGWSGEGCSGTSTCTVKMSVERNVTAAFNLPSPSIASVSPPSGPVGTVVTVAGAKFGDPRGASVVTFNGVQATEYMLWSKTKIKCKVPAVATTGPVKVATAGGTSNGVAFTVTGSGSSADTAGPDQKASGGARVVLSGANSVAAARGNGLSFKWRQVDGTPVRIAGPQSLETWFTAPAVAPLGESLLFELTVTARDGSESKGTCIVNVSDENRAPVAHSGRNRQATGSEIITLDGSRSRDPDDQPLSYSWQQIRGPSVTLSDPRSVRPTFVAPDVGPRGESFVFELTVADAGGLRSRDRCVVNVSWGNEPPRARAGLTQKVQPGARVGLDGSGSSDNDDGVGFYRWRQTLGKPVKLSDPTAIRPVFNVPESGFEGEALVFELAITDAGGLLQTEKVTITVKDPTGGKETEKPFPEAR